MLALVRDMRELCPDALLMNYTNPMSILTWAVYQAYPQQAVVGLCHNVQFTASRSGGIRGRRSGTPLSYHCAGINHMTTGSCG